MERTHNKKAQEIGRSVIVWIIIISIVFFILATIAWQSKSGMTQIIDSIFG